MAQEYGCDRLAAAADDRLLRAVTVAAPPSVVWAWLGNLRVAPYSYDWLDNVGRRSPRRLADELPELAPGQRVMTIFTARSVEPGADLTVELHPGAGLRLFGPVTVTYAVREAASATRLIAVVRVAGGRGAVGAARRRALAWGDLVMMRKQLLTLRALAERTQV